MATEAEYTRFSVTDPNVTVSFNAQVPIEVTYYLCIFTSSLYPILFLYSTTHYIFILSLLSIAL